MLSVLQGYRWLCCIVSVSGEEHILQCHGMLYAYLNIQYWYSFVTNAITFFDLIVVLIPVALNQMSLVAAWQTVGMENAGSSVNRWRVCRLPSAAEVLCGQATVCGDWVPRIVFRAH